MKVRWREHEAVLVTLIAAIIIAGYLWNMWQLTPAQVETIYGAPFAKAHIPFSYFERVLLPQIGLILILYVCYLLVNLIISRFVKSKKKIFTFLWAVPVFVIITYIMGPVNNFISFYVNPYYHSVSIDLPLTFGYHPQPFLNSVGGMGSAIFLLTLYLIYAFFREVSINYYEGESSRRLYGITIINRITIFAVVFFALPVFDAVFNLISNPSYYHFYFALTPAMLAVFITNTYWLFPLKGERSFFNWHFLGPILFTTFLYTLFFSIALKDEWSLMMVLGCWAIQVIFTTPVSWLDYQQRKDKILALRGAEKALVKSTADLQFLRSQINPHFLFNALNTLYGTALIEGSSKTAEGIQKLGDMMRFMLHENNMDFIAMEKEIDYLKNYIALQKLRIQTSPGIIIEDNISDQRCNHMIAPMLLIPFVENAFKHGISLTNPSWIKIKLECDSEYISFEVRNSIHPAQHNDPEYKQSSVGLQNVKQRLQILYKGKHELFYGPEGNEYVVRLKIKPVFGKIIKKTINLNWT